MKFTPTNHTLRSAIATLSATAITFPALLFAVTWDGNGNANNSGNWSVGANWDPNDVTGGPTSGGGVGALGDVTSGTRTVSYDSAALNGAVSTLSFTQSTAGATNELLINGKSLSVFNPFTVGASGGTARLTVGSTATSGFNLTPTGGMTLNSGGELVLTATGNGGGGVNFGNVTGSSTTTIAGGTLRVGATTGTTSSTSAANDMVGSLTMTSGSLIIDNATGIADRRISVSGNVNITGGAVTSSLVGVNGSFGIGGATNTLSPTTFDTDLTVNLQGGTQSLTTDKTLGNLTLRGNGASLTKTITSTASGTGIGQIVFINGQNAGTTTLAMGSNLTSGSLPNAANFGGQGGGSSGSVNFGIDTGAGFILDLSGNGGTYNPNRASNTTPITTNYTFSGSGKIRASNFNLSIADQVNIGAGTTLEVSGGASTAIVLSGGGTINASSTLLYTGNAATNTPVTLTSTRSIGGLNVASGALRISTSGLTAQGLVTIASGATLDLSTNAFNATGLTVNNGSITTAANLTIIGTGANVLKTGANTLALTNSANSYTGTTTLQDGRLNFSGTVATSTNSALGNAASAIVVGNSSSTTGARIQLFGTTAGGSLARDINATGGTSVATDSSAANRYRIGADMSAGGTFTYGGALSWGSVGGLAVGRSLELNAVQANTTVVFTGLISSVTGTGSGTLLINGGASGLGAVKLSNSSNSFTNSITVTHGSLLVGGNAPAGGASVLGNNSGAITLADGGTPASNWTVSSGNLASGDAGNPAILTDGAFTVARAINLSNAATFTGGPAPATTGNGAPNSYIIGGNSATSSTFSGAVTVTTLSTANKLLRLSQVAGGTTTLSGVINANADGTRVLNVEKVGAGSVILSGANLYDGTTTVSAGRLVVNGNISTSSALNVNNGGTLAGDGTVGLTSINSGGTLAVGNSPGTMTFTGDLGLGAGSLSDFEINSLTAGNFDLALAAASGTQTVTFNGGSLNLLFQSGFNTAGNVKIFDFDIYAGTGFTTLNSSGLASGFTASFDFTNGIVTVIPEPTSVVLSGFGLLCLFRRRRA